MTEQVSIEAMNETIARFEGRKKTLVNQKGKQYVFWSDPTGTNPLYIEGLWYHESWDELMPVVKKIGDFLQEDLKKRPPHTATHGDMIEVDIHCWIRLVNIKKTHEFVYQFIDWHNEYIKNTSICQSK